jgi:pyruvate formate lyase activating enzyme
MLVGGLHKNSFIDFPGKISAVIFLSGCNFDCPYCHNPDLAKPCRQYPLRLDPEAVYSFLETRKGFLDGVVISGGEPTLQKELPRLCEKIKQMGYPVKMDTNGSRPEILKHLIENGLVDYIAMDIKTDPAGYFPIIRKSHHPDDIIESVKLILDSKLAHEFKTTCIKPLVSANVVDKITRLIDGAMLYALQRFQSRTVLHPSFFQANRYQIQEKELHQFKSLAENRVKDCIIR